MATGLPIWVLTTPLISRLMTYFRDLGGRISTVLIGVISAHEPPSRGPRGFRVLGFRVDRALGLKFRVWGYFSNSLI